MHGGLKEYVLDILLSGAARPGNYIDYKNIIEHFDNTGSFSRKVWGFLCYEVWQQQFHDQQTRYKSLLTSREEIVNLGA